MNSDILVSLDKYNGPLDLLLDLIKKNEINIYDIPINFITQEYLDTLRTNIELGIEIKVEFLYLAATLLNVKTRMLLPNVDRDDDDPRTDLVEQLIVYSRFKFVQDDMWSLFNRNQESFDIKHNEDIFTSIDEYRINYDIEKLNRSIIKLIEERTEILEEDIVIVKDKHRTEDVIDDIKKILFKTNSTTLKNISRYKDKEYLITSILAILELLNSGFVKFKQESTFSDIYLEPTLERD